MITFYTWLKQFRDYDTPLGDLSRDVLDDPEFPRTKKYDIMVQYLKSKDVPNKVLTVLESSFSNYQAEVIHQ